jgi:clorobiocin biosynthesis protein CloN4
LAVDSGNTTLSYRQLDHRANAVAARLLLAGLQPGDRVVLYADKSGDTVVAMQAVLRVGAAYVPIDSGVPAQRAATIVRDCAPQLVLCESHLIADIAEAACAGGAQVLPLVDASDLLDQAACSPVDARTAPDDLAYILYTSGSTGTPKGVCISHRNAMSFVDWAVAEIGATATDRFSNHAPFGFDLSVLDLYGAFAVGASVHLIPKVLAYAPTELVRYLNEHRISVWYSVPSALILMITEGGLLDSPAPAELRAVLFAGEPFPIPFVRQLASWTSARRDERLHLVRGAASGSGTRQAGADRLGLQWRLHRTVGRRWQSVPARHRGRGGRERGDRDARVLGPAAAGGQLSHRRPGGGTG